MLIRRTGRRRKQDVAAWSTARQAARFWENFGWALAYALGARGDNGYRIRRGLGFDHRQSRLDGKCGGRRLGKSRSLSLPLAMASSLLSAAFLALGGGSISLTGMPGPPAFRGCSTCRAAIASLGPGRQEPAFAIFQQAPAAARVPTVKTDWLTWRQCAGTLKWAHGRTSSRAVRRREGGTSRRHFAPTAWDAARPGPGGRHVPAYLQGFTSARGVGAGREEDQSRDRRIAEWFNWLCDNGSVLGRC